MIKLTVNKVNCGNQRTAQFDKPEIFIGREPDCDMVIEENYISKKHAKINFKNFSISVEDLNSKNGVFYNGKKIGKVNLNHGDKFLICDYEVKVEIETADSTSVFSTFKSYREKVPDSSIVDDKPMFSFQPPNEEIIVKTKIGLEDPPCNTQTHVFCGECGTKILDPENHEFCQKCGKKIERD